MGEEPCKDARLCALKARGYHLRLWFVVRHVLLEESRTCGLSGLSVAPPTLKNSTPQLPAGTASYLYYNLNKRSTQYFTSTASRCKFCEGQAVNTAHGPDFPAPGIHSSPRPTTTFKCLSHRAGQLTNTSSAHCLTSRHGQSTPTSL